MSRPLPYDPYFDPPAPVVPLRVSAPGAQDSALLRALLDTGADCTLLPRAVALALALPPVDEVTIEGITSASQRVPVYAARLALQGASRLARVVAYGHEAILGRDLLNGHCVLLDGPRLTLSFRAPRAVQRRTGRKARAKT